MRTPARRRRTPPGSRRSWSDGWALFYIHGVRVTRQIVEAPETLTVKQIQDEPNAEVRRVMVERFGHERYLREAGAKLVAEQSWDCRRVGPSGDFEDDVEVGKLWRIELRDDEPLVMVEVVNSTPEPIGYTPDEGAAGVWRGNRWHKLYTLRVPPAMQTTEDALRWTFEMPPDQPYALARET